MSASQQKQIPKDALVIASILKELGITDYEPRVINQLLEFTYRYVSSVLEDAKVYANHAKKKVIDLEDVKLAVQMQLDKSFTNPPPRDVLLEMARVKNNIPLPLVKPHCGIRLPPDRYCLNSCNYRLKSTAPKKFGHSSAYSMQPGGLKGPSVSGVGSAMKAPQLQTMKRPQTAAGLTTVPRMQSISAPKPVIKFTPGPAGGSMHNSPMMAPKPKIQIASMNQVEIKMEVEEQGLKRKREQPDFEGADQ